MDATSISKSVGQEPRHSTATATAIRFGRPFVIKNLKFKINNSAVLRELTPNNANYRLTLQPALARGSLPSAVVATGATGEMWQVRLALYNDL
jgi:hypothetical protein